MDKYLSTASEDEFQDHEEESDNTEEEDLFIQSVFEKKLGIRF